MRWKLLDLTSFAGGVPRHWEEGGGADGRLRYEKADWICTWSPDPAQLPSLKDTFTSHFTLTPSLTSHQAFRFLSSELSKIAIISETQGHKTIRTSHLCAQTLQVLFMPLSVRTREPF